MVLLDDVVEVLDLAHHDRHVAAGVDPTRGAAPEATTLGKFRRLLEAHDLTRKIFETINAHLAAQGSMMCEGTIVDATLIAAPPSTKNQDKQRDPEMHQSKKDNDWHFGMKAHVGANAASELVHTLIGTAGNAADTTQAHAPVPRSGKKNGAAVHAVWSGQNGTGVTAICHASDATYSLTAAHRLRVQIDATIAASTAMPDARPSHPVMQPLSRLM